MQTLKQGDKDTETQVLGHRVRHINPDREAQTPGQGDKGTARHRCRDMELET